MLISLKNYFWCVFSEGRACKARAIQMNLFNFPRLRCSRYLDRHWTPPETRVTWQSKQLLRTLIAFVLAYMAIEMALLEEELDQPLLSCFRLEKNDFLCGRLFVRRSGKPSSKKSHEEAPGANGQSVWIRARSQPLNNESCMWLCRFF